MRIISPTDERSGNLHPMPFIIPSLGRTNNVNFGEIGDMISRFDRIPCHPIRNKRQTGAKERGNKWTTRDEGSHCPRFNLLTSRLYRDTLSSWPASFRSPGPPFPVANIRPEIGLRVDRFSQLLLSIVIFFALYPAVEWEVGT